MQQLQEWVKFGYENKWVIITICPNKECNQNVV